MTTETKAKPKRPPLAVSITRNRTVTEIHPTITETVRSAKCWEHDRISEDFCGVNEKGWVFFCRLTIKSGEKTEQIDGHYFIARAPKS